MANWEVVLWCAVKYAHAIDDNATTTPIVEELRPRIPYLGDRVLWEMVKAVQGYLDSAERYNSQHVPEWKEILEVLSEEYAIRSKVKEARFEG